MRIILLYILVVTVQRWNNNITPGWCVHIGTCRMRDNSVVYGSIFYMPKTMVTKHFYVRVITKWWAADKRASDSRTWNLFIIFIFTSLSLDKRLNYILTDLKNFPIWESRKVFANTQIYCIDVRTIPKYCIRYDRKTK